MGREQQLLTRIRDALDQADSSLAGPVQDCLALARLRGELEWSLYFELQLVGANPGEMPFAWKGDPRQLLWQPAILFAEDRKTKDDKLSGHPLESLERIYRDLEVLLSKPPVESLPWAASRVEAQFIREDARRAALESSNQLKHQLANIRTRLRQFLAHIKSTPSGPTLTSQAEGQVILEKRIFVGHGRSPAWRELTMFLHDRLGLLWEEFNRVSPAGLATVQRLEQMLDSSTFALLILTAEDQLADGAIVARQNVVHEAGLFQGRHGFHRAIILLEDGCDDFSNIHGLGQIRFPRGRIDASFEEIRKVLERERVLDRP